MNEIITEQTIITICVISILIPTIILIVKIYFYVNFFKIAKNIKELNQKNEEIINNQDAIIKLLIEYKNKKTE